MKLPIKCPSCEKVLQVRQLKCSHCKTGVNGNYNLPLYMKLTNDEKDFILSFFLTSGSDKAMAKQAGISYLTMRNKIDDLIEKIQKLKK